MGECAPVRSVLRLAAITYGHADSLEWATVTLAREWGDIALRSPIFEFNQTAYYEDEMGPQLKKQILAFVRPMDPAELPGDKLQTNVWEQEWARQSVLGVRRPVNIDPGYLTEAKFVLASTKDRDHRVYLRDGIFAEITLYYHQRAWRSSRWTYPDYQQPDSLAFLTSCRDYLRRRLANS